VVGRSPPTPAAGGLHHDPLAARGPGLPRHHRAAGHVRSPVDHPHRDRVRRSTSGGQPPAPSGQGLGLPGRPAHPAAHTLARTRRVPPHRRQPRPPARRHGRLRPPTRPPRPPVASDARSVPRPPPGTRPSPRLLSPDRPPRPPYRRWTNNPRRPARPAHPAVPPASAPPADRYAPGARY